MPIAGHRIAVPLLEDSVAVLGVVAISANGSDPPADGELVVEEGCHDQRVDTRGARLISMADLDHFLPAAPQPWQLSPQREAADLVEHQICSARSGRLERPTF